MTESYDNFKAEVIGKLGGLTSQEYVDANPGKHLWAEFHGLVCCAFCGKVKLKGRNNKPCVGIVKITLRK